MFITGDALEVKGNVMIQVNSTVRRNAILPSDLIKWKGETLLQSIMQYYNKYYSSSTVTKYSTLLTTSIQRAATPRFR